MSSAVCFNLDQSKILSSGNGLKTRSDKIVFVTISLTAQIEGIL